MTLSEYMNKNFTVIDATSQGMPLQEAIEEVRQAPDGVWFYEKAQKDAYIVPNAAAIATILNAVVKGELK